MKSIKAFFDEDWYLKKYPDVENQGIPPWRHYMLFGFAEKRLPCRLVAIELENKLWVAETAIQEDILQELAHLVTLDTLDGALSAWVLARWYASLDMWQLVIDYLPYFFSDTRAKLIINHEGPWLLFFTAYIRLGSIGEAKKILEDLNWHDSTNKKLASSMLIRNNTKFSILNDVWSSSEVSVLPIDVSRRDACKLNDIVSLYNNRDRFVSYVLSLLFQFPKVSVIIPCYNAQHTLDTALGSLLSQSWRNLEILVVDDCSTDESVAVINQWVKKDKRVRLLRQTHNQGAYVARNTGLRQASGRYITVHDSDDWSHPDKIKRQVLAIKRSKSCIASVSHWVRCDNELNFQRWRMEEGWVYRNVSSLMFYADVVKQIGFWDCVSVNADTEYYYRILRVFGKQSIVEVLPGVPLSFGRVDSASLTQQTATHLRTQFSGIRKDYHEAALAWHQATPPEQLYLGAAPNRRPFPVPSLICRGNAEQRAHNDALLLEQTPVFDESWYVERYPDIKSGEATPLLHYCLHGALEGRDPSPRFSTSGYRYAHHLQAHQNPLVHWLEQGADLEAAIPPISGDIAWQVEAPVIVACGHLVGDHWFGAERSFLDVLEALTALPVNKVVVLPSAASAEYVDAIKTRVQCVLVVPMQWWHQQRLPDPVVIDNLASIMRRYGATCVYVNTLVLSAPLLAATRLNLPRIVHVRELPPEDPALCETLGASPDEIRENVLCHTDFVIANSRVVADYLGIESCFILPNRVDLGERQINPMPCGDRLVVGMLSSNLPKKGLLDFVALARWCMDHNVPADFRLYGPLNEHVERIQQDSHMPSNLMICGYVHHSADALSQLDIVVNLSHFQESFGRTVLEAMAAERCVIAYRWGALPELVVEGCGFLVPFGHVEIVGEQIRTLTKDRQCLLETASRAKALVARTYSKEAFEARLFAPQSPFYSMITS